MEAVDYTMGDVSAAVNMGSVAASAHCEGADGANTAGNEETVNTNVDPTLNRVIVTETAKGEDAICTANTGQLTHPVSLTTADSADNTRDVLKRADICSEGSMNCAELTYSGSKEIDIVMDSSVDQTAEEDSNSCESDSDCTSERTCLEAMTTDGQEYYLRLGDTPQRRSALRLSRIIARQQLLRRLAQGRERESCSEVIMSL